LDDPLDLTERELRSRSNHVHGFLLVLESGQLNEDVVRPRPAHLGLRYSKLVGALADDLDGLV
jgi:hypothetical protein